MGRAARVRGLQLLIIGACLCACLLPAAIAAGLDAADAPADAGRAAAAAVDAAPAAPATAEGPSAARAGLYAPLSAQPSGEVGPIGAGDTAGAIRRRSPARADQVDAALWWLRTRPPTAAPAAPGDRDAAARHAEGPFAPWAALDGAPPQAEPLRDQSHPEDAEFDESLRQLAAALRSIEATARGSSGARADVAAPADAGAAALSCPGPTDPSAATQQDLPAGALLQGANGGLADQVSDSAPADAPITIVVPPRAGCAAAAASGGRGFALNAALHAAMMAPTVGADVASARGEEARETAPGRLPLPAGLTAGAKDRPTAAAGPDTLANRGPGGSRRRMLADRSASSDGGDSPAPARGGARPGPSPARTAATAAALSRSATRDQAAAAAPAPARLRLGVSSATSLPGPGAPAAAAGPGLKLVSGPAAFLDPVPFACSRPGDETALPFCNTSLPLQRRVDDLISRLEPADWPFLLTARASPDGGIPRLGIPELDWGTNCLHGLQARCGSAGCPTIFPVPAALGAAWDPNLVRDVAAVSALELRALWREGAGEARAEPGSMPGLPHVGLTCWAPVLDISRDPRWGRALESPSEDPLLNGLFGEAFVAGMQQGPDERYLLAIATLKHFGAYSMEGYPNGTYCGPLDGPTGAARPPALRPGQGPGPEAYLQCNPARTRHNFDAQIGRYDMADTYLPAFSRALRRPGPAAGPGPAPLDAAWYRSSARGVMCAYNSVNGQPSCAGALMSSVLRGAWGWDGYAVSDTNALDNIYTTKPRGLGFLPGPVTTTAAVIKAGLDMDSSFRGKFYYSTGGIFNSSLSTALAKGLLTPADVRTALNRTLLLRFQLGLMDRGVEQPYLRVPPAAVGGPAARAVNRRAARAGLVLLRNEPLPAEGGARALPLMRGRRLAVFGPLANARPGLYGSYYGQPCPGPIGSIFLNDTSCQHSIASELARLNVPPGAAPPAGAAGAAVFTAYDEGVSKLGAEGGPSAARLRRVVLSARAADRVVLVLGLGPSQEHEEKGDRVSLKLPEGQLQLAAAVLAAGPPVILVIVSGGPVALEGLLEAPNCAAAIQAFYPGFEGGTAIAEALMGDYSPGGKLPVTLYPASFVHEISIENMAMTGAVPNPRAGAAAGAASADGYRDSYPPVSPGRTYRYYGGPVVFPFGWGLSYTTFKLAWAPEVAPQIDGAAAERGAVRRRTLSTCGAGAAGLAPPLLLPPDAAALGIDAAQNLLAWPPVDGSGAATFSVEVTNTGAVAGDEVIQAYFAPAPGLWVCSCPPGSCDCPATRLRRQLLAFERVPLPPGGAATVQFQISAEDLQLVDENGDRVLAPGAYVLTFTDGAGQALLGAAWLTGPRRVLEPYPVGSTPGAP